MTSENNYQELKALANGLGIALFGVADLDPIRGTFHESIQEAAKAMRFGVSMGYFLSGAIIEDIRDRPTLVYKQHYKSVNYLLDQAALKVTAQIQSQGHRALPIGASQVVDWEKQKGHLSHKVVGREAGIGFIGRSSLLVNPEHGARFRLVTVLTDLPLRADAPLEATCEDCTRCIAACPAGAIQLEGYDMVKCLACLKEFAKAPGIGVYICGVCVKACPVQTKLLS
jgi:epoxyqueuosine reductase